MKSISGIPSNSSSYFPRKRIGKKLLIQKNHPLARSISSQLCFSSHFQLICEIATTSLLALATTYLFFSSRNLHQQHLTSLSSQIRSLSIGQSQNMVEIKISMTPIFDISPGKHILPSRRSSFYIHLLNQIGEF